MSPRFAMGVPVWYGAGCQTQCCPLDVAKYADFPHRQGHQHESRTRLRGVSARKQCNTETLAWEMQLTTSSTQSATGGSRHKKETLISQRVASLIAPAVGACFAIFCQLFAIFAAQACRVRDCFCCLLTLCLASWKWVPCLWHSLTNFELANASLDARPDACFDPKLSWVSILARGYLSQGMGIAYFHLLD